MRLGTLYMAGGGDDVIPIFLGTHFLCQDQFDPTKTLLDVWYTHIQRYKHKHARCCILNIHVFVIICNVFKAAEGPILSVQKVLLMNDLLANFIYFSLPIIALIA